jgi:hypothetical protein
MWVICESRAVLRVSPQSRLAVRVILTLAPSTRCHVAHERQVAGTAPKTGAHAGTGQELHNKRPRLRMIGLGFSAARARMTFGCPLLRAKCKHSTGSQPPQPPASNHVFCISKVLGVCRRVQSHTHSTLSTFFSPPRTLDTPPTDAVLIFAANRTESHRITFLPDLPSSRTPHTWCARASSRSTLRINNTSAHSRDDANRSLQLDV